MISDLGKIIPKYTCILSDVIVLSGNKDIVWVIILEVIKAWFPRTMFLTKIICHRNFGNEFAFTHSKDYLYCLANLSLSQILEMKLRHRIEFTRAFFFCDEPTLSKKSCPWKPGLTDSARITKMLIVILRHRIS